MQQLLNQYSAALLLLSLAGIVAILLWQYRKNRWVLGVIAVGTIVLAIGYLQVRTGPSPLASASALDGELGKGVPVLVEIYSDFWVVCLSSKPAVDRLERNLEGDALVVRINIRDQIGQEVVRQYGVYVTPTFLVFNGSGNEVYRQSGGFPDTGRLAEEALRSGWPSSIRQFLREHSTGWEVNWPLLPMVGS